MVTQETTHQWSPIPFTASERESIRARVLDLGQRLRDRAYVLRMGQAAAQQSKYDLKALHGYSFYSLGYGPLGLALFYDELDRAFPGTGWVSYAHTYLSAQQDKFLTEGRNAFGLFSGTAGLLFVAHQLTRGTTRYRALCSRTAAAVASFSGKYLLVDEHPYPSAYDLASGALGIGAALLTLLETMPATGSQEEQLYDPFNVLPYLANLVYHLVWLAQRDLSRDVESFANWYLLPEMKAAQRRWYAEGTLYSGYGLRRGLSGLIALLSLISLKIRPFRESGIQEALLLLTHKLQKAMKHDATGRYWQQDQCGDDYHREGWCSPVAWCNGKSGIARALWLAGRALEDQSLCTLALETIAESCKDLLHQKSLPGPSLCHGLAGITLVCAHFASETEDATLAAYTRTLTNRLLEQFEDDRPFGYRVSEPEYIRTDSPWLLDGAAGVALALLTVSGSHPPLWDRILLLH